MDLRGACKAAARTGFAVGWWEVLPCCRGSTGWGQAVAVVGEADKQLDEGGNTGGMEGVTTAVLADMIRLPQTDKGG